ncbi:kinase with adenine nucleotide alpha hydrolases-like domain-containing protein [Arabidopsis thaliana]|uniref:RING-type E3 ubiquitin transferase n=1 Tax=Arabidopsis thaliana TaxID=3702 RepID=F4JZT9_ARATH|nr:kinase with adenine nucleotide alpha hydrolases-like domain-containing protein [Arabidopsis thaliana]AED93961.1 kinase with adenine nucleotide alpha hydrolases-like domain-containing protein [Arabidopsis thaliana]|eukprot:NP_198388.1 kinase with adenine nucleotide alpha hydrolases-like domain-containing protein [Arabidopsis thaliana]
MVRTSEKREENITLAIDRDKESQNALKWAVSNLLSRGQTLTLLHVKLKQPSSLPYSGSNFSKPGDDPSELFLPFRCYCARKDINCQDVVVEDVSAAKGIVDYVQQNAIETLILGSSKMTLLRFKAADVSSTVMKKAPSFCTVYVISKGKISFLRSATSSPPHSNMPSMRHHSHAQTSNMNVERRQQTMQRTHDEIKIEIKRGYEGVYQPSITDSDISFVSSGRPSVDQMFPSLYDDVDVPRLSVTSEYGENRLSFATTYSKQSIDLGSPYAPNSSTSFESGRQSFSLQGQDELETEMRRLKMELKHTMEMYNSACKEAISAKKAANELLKWKAEKEHKLEEVRLSKEAAMAMAEREKEKSRAAMEAAVAAQKLSDLEAEKRKHIETVDEKKRAVSSLRYRKYTIEEIEEATEDFSPSRKVGEGGYGPVYKGTLDYTKVAIKVLRPDAAQGRSQFQREVEVLTCMRHPNMVLLLGACPEYGCLVYEYMANGSLDDCLFRRGNSPILSWQLRFRIASEIATGLHFLHQMKPEPLVHRDLKPGNILLDQHFVSKISDVGLARLVPPSVADTATQYRMTSTAGTFFYIDPEYQQTGMLGTKSDIYSFGIMLLQILTAKPPMGLTHHVEKAIEKGTFAEMLDPAVPDWPFEEALAAAKLALQCAKLRRKDRPDLGNIVLPELKKLRDLAEESIKFGVRQPSPIRSSGSATSIQEIISDPQLQYGSDSSSLHNSSTS